MANMTLKQSMTVTPSIAKFYVNMAQNIVPLRMKRIDYINSPSFWDAVFQLFKQFMKDKLVKRICFNKDDLSGLYSTVDKDILPTDMGGKVEPFSNKEWKDSILNSEQEFEEDNKFGFLDMGLSNEKNEKAKEDAGLSGLGGTFKKLDVS